MLLGKSDIRHFLVGGYTALHSCAVVSDSQAGGRNCKHGSPEFIYLLIIIINYTILVYNRPVVEEVFKSFTEVQVLIPQRKYSYK